MARKSTTKRDDRPAFPQPYYGEIPDAVYTGMTLRDYFAAQCIAAIADTSSMDAQSVQIIAARAYRIADAMLVERDL